MKRPLCKKMVAKRDLNGMDRIGACMKRATKRIVSPDRVVARCDDHVDVEEGDGRWVVDIDAA